MRNVSMMTQVMPQMPGARRQWVARLRVAALDYARAVGESVADLDQGHRNRDRLRAAAARLEAAALEVARG